METEARLQLFTTRTLYTTGVGLNLARFQAFGRAHALSSIKGRGHTYLGSVSERESQCYAQKGIIHIAVLVFVYTLHVKLFSFVLVSGTRVVSVLILDVIRSVITDIAHIDVSISLYSYQEDCV